jgi:CheY-like chemotaxis protein
VNSPNCYAEVSGSLVVPEASVSHLRILVVEDESLIALNLELILRRFGCEVVGLVSDVDDIVEAVKKYRPDGIFLDVNLRGRKVFDVLAEVISFGAPCVLSSGYDDPTLFPEEFRSLPRIAKPFDEQALHRVCVEFRSLAQSRQTHRGEESRMPRRPGLSARAAIRLAHSTDLVRNPLANEPGKAQRRTAAAPLPSEAGELGKSECSEILRDRNRDPRYQGDRKIRRAKSVYSRNPL